MTLWVEADLATERQKQLADKMSRYYYAWQHSDETELEAFPLVLFLVPDDMRLERGASTNCTAAG